ncbi:hypothetical protein TNCV_4928181 [Trichonephila clavipes]|nr:hypothetical protein TNCV_4928181 [Trichonephila clavipes]
MSLEAHKFSPFTKYFHRLYVNFSNCSTICGGLFWPRIKLFWIPLFGFNHFEPPKTQQLVSEVGLNANNKSDGGPVPDSSRKIDRQHECQYGRNEIGLDRQHECQHGRNEIGVDRQHECQYGRNEIGLDRQYRRIEYQVTNVNEQISANMDELNNKLETMEELKSDLKGIGDKLTTVDKKFEEMEGRTNLKINSKIWRANWRRKFSKR